MIVELDGRGAHQAAQAFEADRKRDRRLSVEGWRPIRLTWRGLTKEAAESAEDLRILLT